VLAGLGREVQTTGLLTEDAVEKALAALRRFRALCHRLDVAPLWVIATAACRDAKNGKSFVTEAERICGTKVDVLSGKREAELSALGVVSGFHKPDGIVGDLGGGSLELTGEAWRDTAAGRARAPGHFVEVDQESGKVRQEGARGHPSA
jgi:exopolyphosphatase/guanosine-5'-triphosphate,3'-diphosphate pyrophosphatase